MSSLGRRQVMSLIFADERGDVRGEARGRSDSPSTDGRGYVFRLRGLGEKPGKRMDRTKQLGMEGRQ